MGEKARYQLVSSLLPTVIRCHLTPPISVNDNYNRRPFFYDGPKDLIRLKEVAIDPLETNLLGGELDLVSSSSKEGSTD